LEPLQASFEADQLEMADMIRLRLVEEELNNV
jgi:hypothetical protein